MKTLTTFALLTILCLSGFIVWGSLAESLPRQQLKYEQLKAEAERLYAEGSYGLAYQLYQQANALDLSPKDARWVGFRLADTSWRSQAATRTSDSTVFDRARQQLEAMIRDIQRQQERDSVWAEVQESLGDFWWTRRNARNWGQGWGHYRQALDFWAGATDIELARERYLKIVWTIAKPPHAERYYYYGYYGNRAPLQIFENALKIAQTENDKAQAHYLIAMTLTQQGGNWAQRRRVPEEFEAALSVGTSTDWYDDALYHYAEWLMNTGRIIALENGQWRNEPDYVKALQLYRRLVDEHQKGETRYYDQAKQRIESITKPTVGVSVSNIFLNDSEIQFHLNWRNLSSIDLTLTKVDLTRDVNLMSGENQNNSWIESIDLSGREKLKSWSKQVEDKGDYKPGQETMRLDSKLPTGAYILQAKSGQAQARDVILVTDASLVLKTSGRRALVYFCNALDGSPIAGASVTLWEGSYNGNTWIWREKRDQTDGDGITVFDLTHSQYSRNLFVSAAIDERQAFATGNSHTYGRNHQPWRVYAFTDRPAYCPNEEVQWKFVARRFNGSVYSTPSNQTLKFTITDPRGSKVKESKATLNAFGSAWGSLKLSQAMPLGEYQVNFWDGGRGHHIGRATLFRLEEYKLPEFKVSVETPEEDGKRKAFRLGDTVEVNIQADYYFGGAVANATVEVLVYQRPFYHWWHPPRDFPWYYEDITRQPGYYGGGQGQVIKRETLKTDAAGKAALTFDTPRSGGQDFEYRIEARVTDSSRREIIGNRTVRVTRQRYYVYPRPRHNLYRPQDKVTIDIKTIDANQQPVQVEGQVKVTRDYWFEIWLDPNGKEVKGKQLQRLRQRRRVFPPPVEPGRRPWQLKFRGYQHGDILSQTVRSNPDGEADLSFKPEREGYYRIAWMSRDKDGAPIQAETTVWVTTNKATELGYRPGNVEIIVDKDTFRAGQTAPVMLTAPTAGRYVLLSIEGEDLYSYQLVHLTGRAKLVEIPINEKHVPNIFLSAAMVSQQQIFMDSKEVVVPPVKHFLTVDVTADRQQYLPRQQGMLTITTRDQDGNPVAAEVALGLTDESVFYIQQDYAGDPRQFYYGTKRRQYIQTQSTFYQKSYVKLVEGAENQLIDAREQAARNERRGEGAGAVAGGFAGGALGEVASYEMAQKAAARPINGRQDRFMSAFRIGARSELAEVVEEDAIAPAAPPAKPSSSEPAVQIRSDFRSTAFWQPDVATDSNGQAKLKVKFPDSLTGWRATARTVTRGNQFGIATASVRTQKPLIVRLQAPRFFVVGDEVTISAVINNTTDQKMRVAPTVTAEGLQLLNGFYQGRSLSSLSRDWKLALPPKGEDRIDWVVSVKQPGVAKVNVTARADQFADAMERSYSVYEHGLEKLIVKSGKLRGRDVAVKLDIPKERKPESTTLTVQVTPSLAVTMLDALPYLIDYPYGCTEQTMSRFLPAAIVVKTLKDLGLQPEAVMGKIFGGIEREYVSQTHPKGEKDLRQLEDMTWKGLDRLYDFQHDDGGWAWWKRGDSDHFMTAYVVWGLTLARDAGIQVKSDVLERAVNFLDKEIVEEESRHDMQAWMLHALSVYHASRQETQVGKFQATAFENLWTNRDRLNAYTRALLALSAHYFDFTEQAQTLIRNLENGVKIDNTPDVSIVQRGRQRSHQAVIETAHWGEDGVYWRWSDGGVEATAFALRALLTIDPQNALIEPVTNWLIKNRRGAQWSNTRDTAIAILALNDYLRQSGELAPEIDYELLVNGHSVAREHLTAVDVLSAPSRFEIDPQYIRDGSNEVRIRRSGGDAPLYFAARAEFFSLEEPITPVGNEIFVRRQYYKLVGRPTLLKGYVYDKQPLNDGQTVRSGDRVEAVVTIEAKNNYEYLVFEDLKPAGLEAVQIRSGEPLYARELKSGAVERKFTDVGEFTDPGIQFSRKESAEYTGRARWVHQELRDRKVALFIDKLPEGYWQIRYVLRAETPGRFHALPVMGRAMYVPEIRANGAEIRINVEDRND